MLSFVFGFLLLSIQNGGCVNESNNNSSDLYFLFLATRGLDGGSNITSAAVHHAVESVNRNQDLNFHGRTIKLTEEFTKCDHKKAQSTFHQSLLVKPHEVAVIGTGCSVASVAVAEIARYYDIPLMSYASTSIELNAHEDFPSFFRTVPSDVSLMQGVARFVQTYSEWEQVVIICQDEEQYKMQSKVLEDELTTMNVTVAIIFISDFSSSGPLFPPDQRIFVLNMDPSRAKYTLCEAIKLQLNLYQYVWILQGWYMDRWWTLEDPLTEVLCNASSLEDFLVEQRAIAISYYSFNVKEHVPADITGLTPENFTQLISSPSARYAYDAVLALAIALNDTFTEVGVNSSLQIDGVVGFNSEFGELIVDNLNQLRAFQGISGMVNLVNGTRVIEDITVLQYRGINGTAALIPVGVISLPDEDTDVTFVGNESRELLWPDGIPLDGRPITEERFPYLWLTLSSYICASIVIIGAIISILFTLIFRKRKLVRLTSPNMNLIIAFGVIVFNSGVFLFVYPPVSEEVLEVFCALRSWLISIGFSICFGTVNAKMWRIYYIFYNPSPSKKNKPLKDWHLVLIVLGFVSLDTIILALGSAFNTARLQPVTEPDVEHSPSINEDGITVFYNVTLCDSDQRLAWLAVLFGYKAIIQAIGLFLALRIRNIKIKVLNDSKEIAATLYLSSAILAIVIVISVALSKRLNVYTASYCYGIPLATSVVLIVVFFTKMVRLYRDPWGENIFSQASPSGNFSSAPAVIANTVARAETSEDRVHILERQVNDLKQQLSRAKDVENSVVTSKASSGDQDKAPANVLVTQPENNSDLRNEQAVKSNGIELGTIFENAS